MLSYFDSFFIMKILHLLIIFGIIFLFFILRGNIMTEQELQCIYDANTKVLSGADLVNKANRTLMYGVTIDRDVFHTYLFCGEIFTVIERNDGDLLLRNVEANHQFTPDKRAFPGGCDYEFCRLLRSSDVWITFSDYDEREASHNARSSKEYIGPILAEHHLLLACGGTLPEKEKSSEGDEYNLSGAESFEDCAIQLG